MNRNALQKATRQRDFHTILLALVCIPRVEAVNQDVEAEWT